MKNILILILTILPFISFGQNLKCCKSEQEVEKYLSGKWKEKNDESHTVYEYWFEKGKGHLSEIEIAENGDELIELDIQPFVEIIKYNNGFKIKFTYPNENWVSELKYLNSNKMILITDGKETEYYKYEK